MLSISSFGSSARNSILTDAENGANGAFGAITARMALFL